MPNIPTSFLFCYNVLLHKCFRIILGLLLLCIVYGFVLIVSDQPDTLLQMHKAYRFELYGVGDVITEVGFDGLTRRYGRDIGGRVQKLSLPDGRRTRYAYDRRGRTTEVVYAELLRTKYSSLRNQETVF
jgi:YD repeat-containing protein